MPLYDYLTPKLDFKRKFNHRQSFLYKGRLIDGADDSKISNRIITTNRIPNRKFDSKSNRILKLHRSLVDTASMTITDNSGLSAEPWCMPTFTSKPLLLP